MEWVKENKPNTSFIVVEVPISWLVFMIAVIFQEKKQLALIFFFFSRASKIYNKSHV